MRALKVLGFVLLGAVALLGGGLLALALYLDSEGFRRAAIGAAQETLGAPVTVGESHVSLFSGAVFRQVVVGNPPGLSGQLLRAESLAVRPRLLPLLRRRLEIAEVRLDSPTVTLVRSDRGEWSFERLVSRPAAPPAPGSSAGGPEAPVPAPAPPALDVVVPRLTLSRGALAVVREDKGPAVEASGIEVVTSMSRVAGALAGQGHLTIASFRVAERVEARELAAPLRFGGDELTLAPVQGKLAGGRLEGQVTVRLSGPTRYTISLDLRDGQAETLLAGLGGRSLSGRLQGQASFTGAAEGVTGQGHAEIRDGQLHDLPVLGAVAAALDLPFLRDLKFQEGAIDFVLAGDALRTPVVRFVSGDVRILGKGEVLLATGELRHELTLLVPETAVRRAPREMRNAFTDRGNGSMGVDFRVWGPYRSPRTDLQDRVLRGFAESLLKKGLKQLLR
ncbi:MAG TPA: AsmA-like C-terminal region-containing protein [Methylomirabilota bacterium]